MQMLYIIPVPFIIPTYHQQTAEYMAIIVVEIRLRDHENLSPAIQVSLTTVCKHILNTHQQTAECLAIQYLEIMLAEINFQPVQTIASNTSVRNNSMHIHVYVYHMKYIWHPQANNSVFDSNRI